MCKEKCPTVHKHRAQTTNKPTYALTPQGSTYTDRSIASPPMEIGLRDDEK